MVPMIKVWRFHDAPKQFQDMSPHGGDEDWIAVVPGQLAKEHIGWLEPGGMFGVADVSSHPQPDGSVIKIGAHA